MRLDRLEQAIAVMKRAGKVDMSDWQGEGGSIQRTEAEMHTCGNSACFAGWLAVSPEFQAAGGFADLWDGHPRFGDKPDYTPAETVAEWLGAEQAHHHDLVELLIFGTAGRGWWNSAGFRKAADALTRWGIPFSERNGRLILSTWRSWGANEVIFYLERLKEEVK